mmetsp:Transcript_35254/g.74381  ORF Transcript_35254/g.74381 Transcript_35254/m.74381 type:complete len:130 (-) Transcript_35254:687-1076(-)
MHLLILQKLIFPTIYLLYFKHSIIITFFTTPHLQNTCSGVSQPLSRHASAVHQRDTLAPEIKAILSWNEKHIFSSPPSPFFVQKRTTKKKKNHLSHDMMHCDCEDSLAFSMCFNPVAVFSFAFSICVSI